MNPPRLMIGVLTASLLGAAAVTVAAPAYAATISTSATLEASADLVVFSDDIYLDGGVTGVDPATGVATYVTTGTISLQVLTSKNPTWVTVATDTTPSSYFFSDIKPDSNSQYKVVYSGGASTTDTFTPSESAPVSVDVQRKVKVAIKSEQLTLKVTVKPDFAKKNIKVFIKKGNKYELLKKVRTDSTGKASIKLPAKAGGGKLYFRIVVPGDAHYAGFREDYYTYSY